MKDIFDYIKNELNNNEVVLFMKGTANAPCCGFSNFVSLLLKKMEVKFKDINVLDNDEVREGIKRFSNWPTIPQLYIKGEFIGGCDIVKEMYQSKELQQLLKGYNISFTELATS